VLLLLLLRRGREEKRRERTGGGGLLSIRPTLQYATADIESRGSLPKSNALGIFNKQQVTMM